jgi:NAD(P)-dependent dehydrogenase (short-subunit alcohol dehydrogenase family)
LFVAACIVYYSVSLPLRGSPVRIWSPFSEPPSSNVSRTLPEYLSAICSPTDVGTRQVVLVTGGAGFVGFHTSLALQQKGAVVVGYDNFNDYYPVSLKRARQAYLDGKGIKVVEADLNDAGMLSGVFSACKFTHVIHLAAQAGVRYAARNPQSYVQSNIAATVSLFEVIKGQAPRPRVVYASSSSVYGAPPAAPILCSRLHTRAAAAGTMHAASAGSRRTLPQ